MFQLTDEETVELRSQNAATKMSRSNPYVFTEKGAWNLSNVLTSDLAIEKGLQLMDILEKLRDFALQHQSQLPATTVHQITLPSSVVNVYNYGNLNLQQGSYNQQNIQLRDVVFNLQEIKEKSDNSEFNKKIDLLISALIKKEEKSKVLKAMESVISVAKGSKSVAEFGMMIAGLVNSYFSIGM